MLNYEESNEKYAEVIEEDAESEPIIEEEQAEEEVVAEIKKSIERGEMTKRILADKDSILKKRPVGMYTLASMFFEDLTSLRAELLKKHEWLKKQNYIVIKDKKAIYNIKGGLSSASPPTQATLL